MVSVVLDLRAHHVLAFSAPIEYRENKNISKETASALASGYAKDAGGLIHETRSSKTECPPVYWEFGLRLDRKGSEMAGGVIRVDRSDGHIWTSDEYEEYMYDYNSVL